MADKPEPTLEQRIDELEAACEKAVGSKPKKSTGMTPGEILWTAVMYLVALALIATLADCTADGIFGIVDHFREGDGGAR